ncbi:MAG: hypothetical protein CMM53_06950 [Rhodospirillaceae bacterium]|nr:hypothetical protein [Rhodospirillaceae bacterium]|tara:strand:+ start:2314 stop:2880 length:567 start_codon:yes stop_codon:yes gene_type:complete
MDKLINTGECLSRGQAESYDLISDFCKSVGDLATNYSSAIIASKVPRLLTPLLVDNDFLLPEQRLLKGDDYEKYEIFLCPNDLFSVLAIVWPAGIYSPIHDHQTWCAFGVLEGEIEESKYALVNSQNNLCKANLTESVCHQKGAVTYMSSERNIHRIHNPGKDPAISIHVYGGNYKKIGANVDQIYNT